MMLNATTTAAATEGENTMLTLFDDVMFNPTPQAMCATVHRLTVVALDPDRREAKCIWPDGRLQWIRICRLRPARD